MPPSRELTVGAVYHVMNKSIAGYKIFKSKRDYTRMRQTLRYFALANRLPKFSQFLQRADVSEIGFEQCLEEYFGGSKQHVQYIAYCLMPTHIHLIVKQARNKGISTFMSNTLNSYTRYFNTKYKRKGPLWVGRFKNVLVETDEQLLHLTRYLHLNPATAGIINKPEDWKWSSYQEYINPREVEYPLCQFSELLDVEPKKYRVLVNDYASYQRDLAKVKKLAIE